MSKFHSEFFLVLLIEIILDLFHWCHNFIVNEFLVANFFFINFILVAKDSEELSVVDFWIDLFRIHQRLCCKVCWLNVIVLSNL
jgi:hypothetical protein